MPSKRLRHPKQTEASEAGRVVRRAAKFIEEHGWVQGTEGSKKYGFCTVGAIRNALPLATPEQENLRAAALMRFSTWLRVSVDESINWIPMWNDDKSRTRDEVLLYMNKFADEMDPQR